MPFRVLKYIRSKRWVSHICFWLGYLVFFTLLYTFGYAGQNTTAELKKHFINLFVGLPSFIFATYFTAYIIIPKLFLARRALLGIVSLLFALSVAALSDIFLSYLFLYNLTYGIPFEQLNPITWQLCVLNIPWVIYPVVIFSAIKFVKDHYEAKVEREEAKRKSAEYEHRKLLRQLNPHFLFNNLNNLYQLTLDKSDKASVMVEKISAVFHYVLHESYEKYVSLQKEVEFIESYLSLVDLRFEDFVKTKLEVKGNVEQFKLIPMVLYNLVDNNVNQGTLQSATAPYIYVFLEADDERLIVKVENSLDEHQQSKLDVLTKGIDEIREHLEQLYGGKFVLKIEVGEDRFITFMELNNINLP